VVNRERGADLPLEVDGRHSARASEPAAPGIDVTRSRAGALRRTKTGSREAGHLRAIFVTARPRQWAKNVLVFGAPATGGVLLDPAPFLSALAAFIAFCLVASGIYFVNDVVDVASDRQHPTKRYRPVASGELSVPLAATIASVLIAAGLGVGLLGGGIALLGVLAGYVTLFAAYTLVLRNIALLDLAAVAGGFLLRAVAGGVATDVPLSMWFLMVAGFGSLFLAAGKRHAEYVQLGEARTNYRRSLGDYSEPYLRYIQYSASTVVIAAYSLWAFEGAAGGSLWSGLSIIPFVLGIFRYALLLEKGFGETPEDVVLTDPSLLVLGLGWVLLVVTGVYLQ
jgi:decaprenyl-phosphate phosphoribosyltransferase